MPKRRECFEIRHYYDVLDLIKLSTTKLDIVAAFAVHSLAIKAGVLAHLPSSTSLLIKYSRAGYVGYSMTLSDEIVYKDVVVWNAMLTATVENHCYVDSMKLFVEMIKGNEFDSASLVIGVSVISRSNKISQGREVHCLSVKAGMMLDTFFCNALINMYAKCGDLGSSESLFERLECRDAVSWNSMICGCLYNDEPVKSLLYFKEMSCSGVLADNVSLSSAVAACTHLGEWDAGQVFHGLGVKLGFDGSTHISVSNSLIPFYSGCGEINVTHNVFRRLMCKDVVTWNAMIDGFATNGMIIEAFDCLYEMQSTGHVHPDTVTILTILPLCAELNLSREGKTIHAFTLKRAMGLDLSIMNSLIDMYMKCNRVKDSEQSFQAMPETDLVTWNTMISGYSHSGHSREAQALFKKLLHWCSRCSMSTMLGVTPSCNSPASLDFGKLLHGWLIKLGFLNNMRVVSSLMFMYINCGDLKTCFSLVWRYYAIMDTACWNAVIVGCTQNGYYLDSLRTFNLMRRETQVSHDSITLVSVISACGNLELLLEGQRSHGLAVKTLVDADIRVQNALITMYGKLGEVHSAHLVFNFCNNRNLCSWNCMISALSQNNDAKEALALFRSLDFEPNEITIATIISVCTQLGVAGFGKQIHGYVFRFQFHTNSFVIAALVDSYSNSGRLERAATVFRHSSEKSVAAWNSMMSAYGFHSKGQDAIKLFHEMILSGNRPNKSTFISLLSSCSHVGLVDEGIWHYDRMAVEYGVQPTIEHHVCLVDLLGKSGRLCNAYEFIKQIQCEREPGLWGALLSACNYHGDVEMGRKVADILFELDPGNTGYYISLSNMYVAAGRWGEAVELRSLIQDKRLKKPAGYSLLDVGLG
ncbi:Pentatricopeptide repeat-containing protein [Heracleum sosnowskyi]|uniref:Pentatricopeptide repeat-containing protein n=1 Tax=Heracleum sosnowskyi TaxID=360622 RepID=A0AAD8HS77_9APIA|nr:Pentatricopeptide repeat-containing protein [Heracleum sosnowskyi]